VKARTWLVIGPLAVLLALVLGLGLRAWRDVAWEHFEWRLTGTLFGLGCAAYGMAYALPKETSYSRLSDFLLNSLRGAAIISSIACMSLLVKVASGGAYVIDPVGLLIVIVGGGIGVGLMIALTTR
jgi:hypothetical protein